MTADLGDRLADAIDAAAAPVTLEEAVVRGRRQRRRRRAARAVVTAGVIGIAAVSVAATRQSDPSRVNVTAPTTPTHPAKVVAPACTAADLRRPWPPMPQPERVVKRYVLDATIHIDPFLFDLRPAVSAEQAWVAARSEMTDPASSFYPPAGGAGSILLGYVQSGATGPSFVNRSAWIVILRNAAQNALRRGQRESPAPNPPCSFGHDYAVIDATTGRVLFAGAGTDVPGDTLRSNPGSLEPFPTTSGSVPGAVTTTTAPISDRTLDLRTVDWNNIAVPGRACFSARDIQLRNGRALLPDNARGNPVRPGSNGVRYDDLELGGRVSYGDFESDGHADAAVPLDCNNNGGTAGGALLNSVAVYSGRTGQLTFLGLITPQHQPEHVLPTLLSIVVIEPGTIAVHEAWYGPNDGTCCPTGRATTTWSISRGNLEPAATQATAPPK